MDGTLTQYLMFIESSFRNRNGSYLANAISLCDDHVLNINLRNIDVGIYISGKCIEAMEDIVVSHLLCVDALHVRDFVSAFNYQNRCVTAIATLLQDNRGQTWILQLMNVACTDLRLVAQKADGISNNRGHLLEKAAECIATCFRVCAEDTNFDETSQRDGALRPVNQLLRIYFKIDKYSLCQNMIRAVQPALFERSFTLSDKVTFKFFLGRIAAIEADFNNAERYLKYAFKKCHKDCFRNKQIILSYLVLVKMLLGYMPPKELLEKYDLPLYWNLLNAVKDGNLKAFEDIVEGNRPYFTKAGLFVALENLRVITYRNVFKKVFLARKSTNIPVAAFQAGLQLMSEEKVDSNETQCLIASMIYTNKIKAYLSYQYQIVVFNRDNPFPKLSTMNYPGPMPSTSRLGQRTA